MKKLTSTLLASILFTTLVSAEALTTKEFKQQSTQTATESANDKKATLVKEALSSLELSAKALEALKQNKIEDAKGDLELALGKLEVILASKEVPKLLPIENRVVVKNFIGTAEDVDVSLKLVKKLLEEGKVQEAGELLYSLQSEIDVTVVNLPLVTYPDAIKLASKYIIDKKPKKAQEVLGVALSTFAQVKEIIPIPLVNATDLVNVSSQIVKKNKEQALLYLVGASDELDKAEKLGYLSKSTTTYKGLHERITALKKEINGENNSTKLFDELKSTIKEFKKELFSEKDK